MVAQIKAERGEMVVANLEEEMHRKQGIYLSGLQAKDDEAWSPRSESDMLRSESGIPRIRNETTITVLYGLK